MILCLHHCLLNCAQVHVRKATKVHTLYDCTTHETTTTLPTMHLFYKLKRTTTFGQLPRTSIHSSSCSSNFISGLKKFRILAIYYKVSTQLLVQCKLCDQVCVIGSCLVQVCANNIASFDCTASVHSIMPCHFIKTVCCIAILLHDKVLCLKQTKKEGNYG